MKHHGWSDPLKHYERLKRDRPPVPVPFDINGPWVEFDDAFEWVNHLIKGYAEDYALVHGRAIEDVEADEQVMGRLCALAAMEDQEFRTFLAWLTNPNVEKEGEYETDDGETITVTYEGVNPADGAGIRRQQRWRNERRDLGIDPRSVRKEREFHEQMEGR